MIRCILRWCGGVWWCVVWDDVEWYDVVWCGVVWCGVRWYDIIWYDIAWYDGIRYHMMCYGVVWCEMIWYDMILCEMMWRFFFTPTWQRTPLTAWLQFLLSFPQKLQKCVVAYKLPFYYFSTSLSYVYLYCYSPKHFLLMRWIWCNFVLLLPPRTAPYFTLLYSTLLYSTLLYSTQLNSTEVKWSSILFIVHL